MPAKVNPIRHVGPGTYLKCDYAKEFGFLKATLGAKERVVLRAGTMVCHAEVSIPNGGNLYMAECSTRDTPNPSMYLYVADSDAVYAKAVKAGAKSTKAPHDEFWGDRCCTVADPAGIEWCFLTQKEDLSQAEMQKRMDALMAKGGECCDMKEKKTAKPVAKKATKAKRAPVKKAAPAKKGKK